MNSKFNLSRFKIGNIEIKKESIEKKTVQELFTILSLNELQIFLEGHDYIIDIEHYLRIGNLNQHSDRDLETVLESISSLRFTLTASEADLEHEVETLVEIMEIDKAIKMNQLSAGFTKITDKQLTNNFMMTEEGKLYSSRKRVVGESKKMLSKIKGLQFILAERVKILQSMLDRRYFVKGGRGKDGSV